VKRVVDRGSRQEEKKKKMTVSILAQPRMGQKSTKGTKLITSGYREHGKRRRTART